MAQAPHSGGPLRRPPERSAGRARAQREGAEGSVTLYFIVRPDGSIKENVLVQKTAGFEDFDENARAALRAWRFAALPRGQTGEQWGTITFHFRLRGA